jgi:hypothetical protein
MRQQLERGFGIKQAAFQILGLRHENLTAGLEDPLLIQN